MTTDNLSALIAHRIPTAPEAAAEESLEERRTAARLASQERVNTLGFPRSS